MKTLTIGLFGLLALSTECFAAPTIALQSGTPVAINVPANSFTTSYYIDVTDADQTLRIDLGSTTPGVDVDLFLRHGTPFPDSFGNGQPVSFDYTDEVTHYRSAGPTSEEFLVITKTGGEPLRAGRWYLFVYNFNNSSSTNITAAATLTATLASSAPAAANFTVNFNSTGTTESPCSNTEWFDTTAATPVGGNPGTTVGELRRNAMLKAAETLAQEIRSPVPISIDACWANLGTGNSVTLASAGPRTVFRDFPSSDSKYTWYPGPPAARLAGTSACRALGGACSSADIRATFNNQIDTPAALGATSFYYGYNVGGIGVDFISVGTHEITHGLGFLSLVSLDAEEGTAGAKFLGFNDIFSSQIAWLQDGNLRPFDKLTDAERVLAAVADTNLKWSGLSAANSFANPNSSVLFPQNLIQLYAPNPIASGSSVSHINQFGYGGELMRPQAQGAPRTLSLARNMFDETGWSNVVKSAPIDPIPFGGFFFDPKHNGHGIEFSPLTPGGDLYVLTFYTYGSTGDAEWFQALGRFIDGRFLPEPDANGQSLQRYTYDPNRPSGQRQKVDPTFLGQIRLDFVQAALSPVCAEAQGTSGSLAVMSFSAGNTTSQQWCMQELIPKSLRPQNDRTGIWYAGDQDSGWGYSLGSIPDGGSGGIFSILYYYDGNGMPRWALSALGNLQAGSTADMISRTGYCRTCEIPAGFPTGRDNAIGTIKFNLQAAGSAGSNVSFSATWPGTPSSAFARTASPLTIISRPAAVQTPQ